MMPSEGMEVQIHKILNLRAGDERPPSLSGLWIQVHEPVYNPTVVIKVKKKKPTFLPGI